ncbi:MAG: ABC transporter ATP-binding protein [Armatimonadota bacterium]
MITATNVSLVYNDHEKQVFACNDVTLEVKPGEFLGILGPSGSGKSSLLYLLSGLKNPTTGNIKLRNQDLQTLSDRDRAELRRKHFGFVFQQPFLLGYLTALENILAISPNSRQRAEDLLAELGLKDKLHRLPHELSGGERQRVCVARALINQPEVIFADEPTAALDHANGEQVVQLLDQHRGKGSLVMVTHDPSMLNQANRIVGMNNGQTTAQR